IQMQMTKGESRGKGPVRRIAVAAMAAVIGSFVVAPSSHNFAQAADQTKGKKVALLMTAVTLPFPAGVKTGFLERAKKYGLEVTSFEQFFDAARQVQQMDDAIARKFDIIAVMPVSEQAIV